MSEMITVKESTIDEFKSTVKHQQYIIKQLQLATEDLYKEIKYLRSFPAEALKEEAAKILRNKKARVIKRIKDDDE